MHINFDSVFFIVTMHTDLGIIEPHSNKTKLASVALTHHNIE